MNHLVTNTIESIPYSDKSFHIWTKKLEQLSTYYDTNYEALWCVLKPQPVPAFTTTLLNNIRTIQDMIAEHCYSQKASGPKYIIWVSERPEVFNLGIDLDHVVELIVNKDKKNLDNYIQLCIDVFYINLLKLDIKPTISISLIRGKAFGGGLEAALTSDIIFAEEGSRCCFPEARYNLLPTLGFLTMLLRQVSNSHFISHFLEGGCIPLKDLEELKLIEKIVPTGHGIETIQNFIRHNHKKHRVYSYLYTEKAKSVIVSPKEISEFKRMWLDTALNLSQNDIKKLKRLNQVIKRIYAK